MTDSIVPNIPVYPPQGIQAELSLLYLYNPNVNLSHVTTDGTLVGNGLPDSPLGVKIPIPDGGENGQVFSKAPNGYMWVTLDYYTTGQIDTIVSNLQANIASTYATQTEFTAHISNTNNPHNVTQTQVGLGNVDNTSDLNKPVSIATQDALALKANIADVYTKAEVDAKITSVYKFKGSVPAYSDLPASGNTVGDVWNVEDTGANYAWDGAVWDKLSETVDLTPYLTKEDAESIYETQDAANAALSGKQDTLTVNQLEAVNSGITAEQVEVYDNYSAQITAAQQSADKANDAANVAQQTANLVEQAVSSINEKIPGAASATNQLVDSEQLTSGLSTKADISALGTMAYESSDAYYTKEETDSTYATITSVNDITNLIPQGATSTNQLVDSEQLTSGLSTKADASNVYTKNEVDQKLSSVYVYKGSVPTMQDLPQSDNTVGDVWNVEDTGANYAWDGTQWDKLGGDVDLSAYLTKEDAADTYATATSVSSIQSVIPSSASSTNQLVTTSSYTSGLATKANATDLANLTNRVSNNETNITNLTQTVDAFIPLNGVIANSILQIPQNINLTVSNNVLTIAQGSTIYVPNGAGVYTEFTIPVTRTASFTSDGTYLLYMQTDDWNSIQPYLTGDSITRFCSGSTDALAGMSYHNWYDTTNNLIKRYTSDTTSYGQTCSFPIAQVTVANGVTTIDEIFNGVGYIGTTIFSLPGLMVATPNGRNTDGTLKSNIFPQTQVNTYTLAGLQRNEVWGYPNGIFAVAKGSYSYNSDTNYIIASDGAAKNYAKLGETTNNGTVINGIQLRKTLLVADYQDVEELDDAITDANNGILALEERNAGAITNCLQSVPQNLNLTLSNGVLTLKAGSTFYSGSGTGYTTTTDRTVSATATWDDGTYQIVTALSTGVGDIAICAFPGASGTNAPSTGLGVLWYDTNNKIVKRWNGSVWEEFSLPLATITIQNHVITSIGTVFNAFGFVGKVVYSLPGITAVMPNGRNADGTLKNTTFTTTTLRVSDVVDGNGFVAIWPSGIASRYNYYVVDTVAEMRALGVNGFYYVKQENIMYSMAGNQGVLYNNFVCVGYVVTKNALIQNFSFKSAFSSVDYSDYIQAVPKITVSDTGTPKIITYPGKITLLSGETTITSIAGSGSGTTTISFPSNVWAANTSYNVLLSVGGGNCSTNVEFNNRTVSGFDIVYKNTGSEQVNNLTITWAVIGSIAVS